MFITTKIVYSATAANINTCANKQTKVVHCEDSIFKLLSKNIKMTIKKNKSNKEKTFALRPCSSISNQIGKKHDCRTDKQNTRFFKS